MTTVAGIVYGGVKEFSMGTLQVLLWWRMTTDRWIAHTYMVYNCRWRFISIGDRQLVQPIYCGWQRPSVDKPHSILSVKENVDILGQIDRHAHGIDDVGKCLHPGKYKKKLPRHVKVI